MKPQTPNAKRNRGEMNNLIDITRKIDASLATWPGDAATEFKKTFAIDRNDSVNVGQLSISVHTGTHCDSPRHFDDKAIAAEQLPLKPFIGECRVIDVRSFETITLNILQTCLSDQFPVSPKIPNRVLLRTDHWLDSAVFPDQIPVITTDVANWLGTNGVQLLGVDLPSVDQLDDAKLPVHFALQRQEIHILEGLDLSAVEPADYELIALPLPIAGSDGSPVRAILRR